jgi:HAD superfamily hydrolase (TIGR01509 family)
VGRALNPPLRAALFDVGNVLLFFSHDLMCNQLAEVYGCSRGEIRSTIFDSGLAADYDRGRVSTAELFARLSKLARQRVDPLTARRAAACIFTPNEAIVPLLEALRRSDVRLVVVSNTCEVHSSYFLDEYDLFGLFDGVVLSHRVGSVKPERGIFERALEVAGCGGEECIFVDDVPAYAAAARRLGIDATTYRGVAALVDFLTARGVAFGRSMADG